MFPNSHTVTSSSQRLAVMSSLSPVDPVQIILPVGMVFVKFCVMWLMTNQIQDC